VEAGDVEDGGDGTDAAVEGTKEVADGVDEGEFGGRKSLFSTFYPRRSARLSGIERKEVASRQRTFVPHFFFKR
jgi:hypothetical protein